MNSEATTHRSWMAWSMIAFISIFLLISPFYKALFNGYQASFEGAIYGAVAWVSAALLLLVAYIFRSWKPESHADLLSIIIWLIPLASAFSLWNAASSHFAINELYIKVIWVLLFIIGVFVARQYLFSKILVYSILGSGFILVIYGFLNYFGQASYKDAVLYPARLSNVFQYPNAYAAYLIALLIGFLIMLSTANKTRSFIFPALMLVPIWLSLLLTVSRGALLLLPVIIVIYFLFIPWYRQLLAAVYLFISGILAFLLFKPAVNIYNLQKQEYSLIPALKGWALVSAASLIAVVLMYFVFRYFVNSAYKRFTAHNMLGWRNVIIPVIVVIGIVIGYIILINTPVLMDKLPNEIKSRIQSTGAESPSVYARNTFFKDAWSMSSEFPWLGGGGGAWLELYDSYKSYPYVSAQAHNFYLQYLVESGWIGGILLLVFIGCVLLAFVNGLRGKKETEYAHHKLVFPMVSIAILVHSLVDFDMSYVYLSGLVFLTLGAAISSSERSERIKLLFLKIPKFRQVYAVLIAVGAIVISFNAIQAYQAHASFKQAKIVLSKTGDYTTYKTHINKALELLPKHPEYNALNIQVLLDLYRQSGREEFLKQAQEQLAEARQFSLNNRRLQELAYTLEIEREDYVAAIQIVEQSLTQYQWEFVWYERALELYFVQGMNQPQERETHWPKAFDLLSEIEEKQQFVAALPAGLEKGKFAVTHYAALQLGKIMFYEQDFERSSEFLKAYLANVLNTDTYKELVRWYIASLVKQGKTDDEWKNKLIESDPNEEELIQSVINSV